MIYLLIAVWLTPGGSSTHNTQYTGQHSENRIYRTEHIQQ